MVSDVDRIGDLLCQLQSPDFYERQEAVNELASCDQDEAIAGLVMALEDPDLGIRELAADYLSGMKGNIVSQLLIRFLGNEDIGTRNLSAEILVRIGHDAVAPLVAEMDDDDHDVRKFIVDILGLIRDESAVDAVAGKLDDRNTNVVCSAAEALGEIGSPTAIPALMQAYSRCDDCRLQVVEALGKIGHRDALAFLIQNLSEEDPMILYATIEAIGNIGETGAVQHLMRFLDYPDRSIAESALLAVINASITNSGRLDLEVPLDRFADFLFEAIRNKNRRVTQFTLDRLTYWYGHDIIEKLLNVMSFVEEDDLSRITETLGKVGPAVSRQIMHRFPEVPAKTKLALIDILKQFADEEIGNQMMPYAFDQDPDVRQGLAYLFGVSGNIEAIATLKKLAADSVGHVRSAAYAAMGWLCNDRDAEFLFQGLSDPYSDVREAAMGALIIIGGDKVVRRFNEELFCDDVERQRLAATALGLIGDPNVVQPLIQAINHPEPAIRKSAIDSLSRIREIDDPKPLIMALNDENSAVRKSAVSALVAIQGSDAVPELRLLLDDEDIWVRFHTVTAIGDLGQEMFADYIMPLLSSEHDILKIAATKALARMGCRRAIPEIGRLRDERNEDIVKAAELALEALKGE